ncbi:S1 family peptidase [Facklamia hominis]|uniref:Serine protease n=1 Tax=Facklamia hominis CCUG 36813 TaxID=883111 RepID=K1LV26_9LACT|nr:serine protease [Facklamia hominis]EKB53893.1 hypothetical protein HMPREF9706_01517 [Facklamia hominis CCUG 36813]
MDSTEMDMGKQLVLNSLRIETEKNTGSGFVFSFDIKNNFVPVLVTNRHVLQGAKFLKLVIPYIKPGIEEEIENFTFIVQNLEEAVIFHPETSIDLAIVPIADLWEQVINNIQTRPQIVCIDEGLIPTDEEIKKIKTIEDILVVGYPNGIWDNVNNRPVVRRGITATDYKIDFKGEPKFIIDCAIFPGSSGSPVFLASEGMVSDGFGRYTFYSSPQVKLLGINSAVFIHRADGQLVETSTNILTGIPNGLGIIIKSRKLLDFRKVLSDRLA